MILQVGAIHEQLAQHLRTRRDFDAERILDRFKVGHAMARRTDAADARRDIGAILVTLPAHHALEQARWLDDVHLNGLHHVVFDDHMHIAMALDARDMIDIKLGACHVIPCLLRQ